MLFCQAHSAFCVSEVSQCFLYCFSCCVRNRPEELCSAWQLKLHGSEWEPTVHRAKWSRSPQQDHLHSTLLLHWTLNYPELMQSTFRLHICAHKHVQSLPVLHRNGIFVVRWSGQEPLSICQVLWERACLLKTHECGVNDKLSVAGLPNESKLLSVYVCENIILVSRLLHYS